MALGTDQMTVTTQANFIPELWGPQVIAATEAQLVWGKLVWDWSEGGESKGDQKHIPAVSNLTSNAKSANSQVTLNAPTEGVTTLTINRHDECSFLIEDITKIQASFNLMQMYTKKAGYAIAKQRDTRLNALVSGWSQIVGAQGVDIGDSEVLDAVEFLDLADAPQEERYGVVYPTQKNALFRIEKFHRADFRGDGASQILVKGKFAGDIYGIEFFVSSNVGTSGAARLNGIFHKEALAKLDQAGPRTQSAYILEYLGNLVVVDMVYGEIEARDSFGVWLKS